jgi:hypothetical protein
MRRRIGIRDHPVAAPADDPAVQHHHRSDRHFTFRLGAPGLFEG